MKKKLFSILATFIIALLCTSPVFALTINTGAGSSSEEGGNKPSSNGVVSSVTTLEKVSEPECKIELKDKVTGEVVGEFTKKLTDFDASKKEATLTLTLKNLMKKETIKKPVEVFLVLDNSNSMTLDYNGKAKMEYVVETANLFTDALFEYFENPKIGIVSFSAVPDKTSIDDPNPTYGTSEDAKLLLNLSDSKETIKSKITEYSTANHGTKTNIEAGLSLAESNFTESTETEKYVILLSDGVPNLSLDTEHTLDYSGVIAANTKKRLEDMEDKGYHIFSVLMGLNEAESELTVLSTGEKKTRRALAEEIFGTSEHPTAGDFFYINYNSLSTTVNTDIYNGITGNDFDPTLRNVVIKDYFPKEIIDNFDFAYVKSANIGEVSPKVDTTDNSITWTIEVLEPEEVATLSYKLTLKDNYNKEIVDKVLPTNEKVDISYEDGNGKGTATSNVSPTVKVKYVESSKDDSTAKKPIPQTGVYTNMLIAVAIVGITVFAISKIVAYRKLS